MSHSINRQYTSKKPKADFRTIYRSNTRPAPSKEIETVRHTMTTLERKALTAALEARAAELSRSLGGRNHIHVERAADSIDEQVLAGEREASAQTLAHDSRLLREVEAARARIADGSFGVCLLCEEPIAPKRLQAIPWAAYCVSCQAKAEESRADEPEWATAA